MLEIIPLYHRPDCAPVLADWAYREWYRERPLDYEIILKAYRGRTRDESLPLTLVAVEDSAPAGMVTLKLDDLWSRRDLNPWLSSLFVAADRRRRGIGHALIRAVIGQARDRGFGSLYLFLGQSGTEDLERYYVKRGWAVIDTDTDNDGCDTRILRFTV